MSTSSELETGRGVGVTGHHKSTKRSRYGFGEAVIYFCEKMLRVALPLSSEHRWRLTVKSEIRFWDKYLATNGWMWPDEYRLRLDPHLPLQDEISSLLPEKKEITMLDVGAGPLTYIGKVYDKAKVDIVAVDPLADEYDKLLDKHKVTPIVRTIKLEAEKITSRFLADSFDLVFARNCIDHSYSPEAALLEMIAVVKSNHYVLLMHRPNEAQRENYQGLHQWNFAEEDGDFIISSKGKKVNFSQSHKELCDIKCRYDVDQDMLHTVIHKK